MRTLLATCLLLVLVLAGPTAAQGHEGHDHDLPDEASDRNVLSVARRAERLADRFFTHLAEAEVSPPAARRRADEFRQAFQVAARRPGDLDTLLEERARILILALEAEGIEGEALAAARTRLDGHRATWRGRLQRPVRLPRPRVD